MKTKSPTPCLPAEASRVGRYFDDFVVSVTPTRVLQGSEYYPFGLQTAGSWTRANTINNFLYDAGNELNATTGFYDLPFRNYDASVGRFFQVDPLAHTSHDLSPFHYAGNNPIGSNDPSGLMVPYYADPADDPRNWRMNVHNYNWNLDFDGSWGDDFYGGGGGSGRIGSQYDGSQMQVDAAAVRNGSMSASTYGMLYGSTAYNFSWGYCSVSEPTVTENLDGKSEEVSAFEILASPGQYGGNQKPFYINLALNAISDWLASQGGITVTVTDEVTGYGMVRGYPKPVTNKDGVGVGYQVPLYKVTVSGTRNGKATSKDFQAMRWGVYYNGKGSPFTTGVSSGEYSMTWNADLDAWHVNGAGLGSVFVHAGAGDPSEATGNNGCVAICGWGNWAGFNDFISSLGGNNTSPTIIFTPLSIPNISIYK